MCAYFNHTFQFVTFCKDGNANFVVALRSSCRKVYILIDYVRIYLIRNRIARTICDTPCGVLSAIHSFRVVGLSAISQHAQVSETSNAANHRRQSSHNVSIAWVQWHVYIYIDICIYIYCRPSFVNNVSPPRKTTSYVSDKTHIMIITYQTEDSTNRHPG